MSRPLFIFLLFIFWLPCTVKSQTPTISNAQEKTSPFDRYDFKEGKVFVTLDDQEYQWLKLDTMEVSQILSLFQENYGSGWQRRISEDLVEYLNRLDFYPKQVESFTLLDVNGNVMTKNIPFVSEKRGKAKDHYEATYVKELHLEKVLSRQEIEADLDQLEKIIETRYAYAFMNSINAKEELRRIKEQIGDEITVYDFALLLGQFLNKYGDGHSRIRNVNFKESGALPFSTLPFKGKVLCAKDGKLLHEDFPYLHSVNEVEVARLLEVSETYLTPNASDQFKEWAKVSLLSRIGKILEILSVNEKELTVQLMSETGEVWQMDQALAQKEKRELTLSEKLKLLEELRNKNPFEVKQFEEIGYLKIESMDALTDGRKLPLHELEGAKALIIDVRDNGGGRRDILLKLAPHFISKEQGFVVGNVARLRTNTPSIHKNLGDRYLYQLGEEIFNEEAQNHLSAWTMNFTPSVSLNDSLYSPYYYLYIKGHENPKFSNTPTVVLMNSGCYSATDIFLSTFKEIEGVTLMGTPSGGGSGRVQPYQLDNSVIKLTLYTIASFQPNGKLYDGVGVHPDIIVQAANISDVLRQTDSQLDYALTFLKEKLGKR